jgi:NitT/TauT family transport system ATP-binding protein
MQANSQPAEKRRVLTVEAPIKVRADRVTKRYWIERDQKFVTALKDISLSIRANEFVCIVGPSGCGKTTFLNIVAGLTAMDDGEVMIDGHYIDGPGPDRAVVFQSSNLLPWRTVLQNVAYGMALQKRFSSKERRERALYFTHLVGLAGSENKYPSELSGGMQQRVNLARALATDADVLLMDEPFAALDAQTREFMQDELLRIWGSAYKTVLFITHQIDEAVFLADRVFVFGTNPGNLRDELVVPFDRPRPLSLKRDPAFLRITDGIWTTIMEETKRSVRAPELRNGDQ